MICDKWQRRQVCYYCTEGRKARRFYKGHYGYRPTPHRHAETIRDMIKRHSAASVTTNGTLAARDTVMEADRPLLFEYLTSTAFADGSERQTSTLLVFASEGVWKACLNDRAEEQALWASGVDLASALDSLESMLDTEAPDWRRTSIRKNKK